MPFVPVEIVGVVPDEVGHPRNDGARGSALYEVPIQFSRSLSGDEAKIMENLWNHPPQFTTMHRPGIGRVAGDRIVLDGTTVDEVAKYHAKTLVGIVQRFNTDASRLAEQKDRAERERVEAEEAHLRHVDEVASEIRFE